jgi:DNA polymerase III delta prime subunit
METKKNELNMRASYDLRTLTVLSKSSVAVRQKKRTTPKLIIQTTTHINGSILSFLANNLKVSGPIKSSNDPPQVIKKEIEVKEDIKDARGPLENKDTERTKAQERQKKEEDELWTETYRPKRSKDLIGNEKSLETLKAWIHAKWRNDPAAAKALLLYGPPGVGKTTSAQLLCSEMGFDVCEINASDERSAEQLHLKVGIFIDRKSLFKRVAFILDEVDGGETDYAQQKQNELNERNEQKRQQKEGGDASEKMSKPESKRNKQSGLAYLKELVTSKLTRFSCPLIFICNSMEHKSVRDLRDVCEAVRFYPMDASDLLKYARRICFAENIQMKQEDSLQMVAFARGDARKIASFLQMYSVTGHSAQTGQASGHHGLHDFGEMSSSDDFNDIFEHIRSLLFTSKKKTKREQETRLLIQALNTWTSDPQLYNAMIFENYVRLLILIQSEFATLAQNVLVSKNQKGTERGFYLHFADVIDSVSDFDSVSTQYWHPDQFDLLETVAHKMILTVRQVNSYRPDLIQSVGYYAANNNHHNHHPKNDPRKKVEFPKQFKTNKDDKALRRAKTKIVQMFRKDLSTPLDLNFYLQVLHAKLCKSAHLFNDVNLKEEAQEIVQMFFDAGILPGENKDFEKLGWTQKNTGMWERIQLELVQMEKQSGYVIAEREEKKKRE